MTDRLPIFHIECLEPRSTEGGGVSYAMLGDLLDELVEFGAVAPSVASLATGRFGIDGIETPCLLSLGDPRPDRLTRWCEALGSIGFSSIWAVASETLEERGEQARSQLSMLIGQGVVVASRGETGEPLVDMDVGRLRRELTRSREKLSDWHGYPVHWLAPPSTPGGRAVDSLVVDEARRAGYRGILSPGWKHAAVRDDRLPMLLLDEFESVAPAMRWFRGDPASEMEAGLRSLWHRPREWLRATFEPE